MNPHRTFASALLLALLAGCTTASRPPASEPAPAPAGRVQPAPAAAPNLRVRMAQAPDRYADVGDVLLRYRETGTGAPIVLLHGYTRTLSDWYGIADSLALTNRVIVYDLRGHGQSGKSADPAFYGHRFAHELVSLMNHLRLSSAHLVGHSLGALVAGKVAAAHPERVASATLIAGPFERDSAAFALGAGFIANEMENGRGMIAFLKGTLPSMPDSMVVAISRATMAQNDSASLVAIARGLGGAAPTHDQLRALKVPALVVVGTRDGLLVNSRAAAQMVPGARLVEVEGADHANVATRSETLAAIRRMVSGW